MLREKEIISITSNRDTQLTINNATMKNNDFEADQCLIFKELMYNEKNLAIEGEKNQTELIDSERIDVKETLSVTQTNLDEFDINLEENQPMSREQLNYYASGMELARQDIVKLLIKQSAFRSVFAKTYLNEIDAGIEQAEMFSINKSQISENAVQNDQPVQVNAKQVGLELKSQLEVFNQQQDSLSQDQFETIMNYHFLPSFLEHVCQQLSGLTEDEGENSELTQKLKLMMDYRQQIINSNLAMVPFIANKYPRAEVSFSDLIQEGMVGLIKAVDRFDYQRPVKFSTYAVYWIRKMITRAINRQKKSVCLPFNLATKTSRVFSLINENMQSGEKKLSTQFIADQCEISVKDVEAILEFYKPCISLSENINSDDDLPTVMETLEQQHFLSPYKQLSRNSLNDLLKNAIGTLSDREAYIIRTRFGINNGIELTLQEIADQFLISKERVRQIQNMALSKLKQEFGSELSDFLVLDSAK